MLLKYSLLAAMQTEHSVEMPLHFKGLIDTRPDVFVDVSLCLVRSNEIACEISAFAVATFFISFSLVTIFYFSVFLQHYEKTRLYPIVVKLSDLIVNCIWIFRVAALCNATPGEIWYAQHRLLWICCAATSCYRVTPRQVEIVELKH